MADATTVVGTINAYAKFGATTLPHVRSWSLSVVADNPEFGSSSTAGWKGRVVGMRDASGSIECYGDDTERINAILKPQDTGTIELYENATLKWSIPAIIDSVDVEGNPESGDPVSVTINFSATGALTDWT